MSMTVQQVIDMLKQLPDEDQNKQLLVQTVDGKFVITGVSNHHQGIPFERIVLDTTLVQRY